MYLNKISVYQTDLVTTDELKAHCVINHALDDTKLAELINVAVEKVEKDTSRSLAETTWTLTGKYFPAEIVLPKPPYLSIESVEYVDTDGVTQTLASTEYQVVSSGVTAKLMPAPTKSWPAVQAQNELAVVVTFTAGYVYDEDGSPAGAIPWGAKQAILIWSAHLYENREHMAAVQLYEVPSYQASIAGLIVDFI